VARRWTSYLAFTLFVLCTLLATAWGDSLELKNGSIIKGKFLGGNEAEIRFQVGSSTQRYAVSDIEVLRFDQPVAPPSEPPELAPRPSTLAEPPVAPPTSPVNADSITVSNGTRITVRTIDAVDSDRNQVGDKFQASLEQPIIVDGTTVVPKGADVYGRLTQASEAGHIQGRSQLKLELTGIVVGGQTIPLVTGEYSVSGSSRGASTAKRVGGGAGVGALIGAIAGGGKGAAIGAGVGAGAGTAVQVVTKGEQVHVPSETLLEFSLQQDVRVPLPSSDMQGGR
jgi:hypothetical protein